VLRRTEELPEGRTSRAAEAAAAYAASQTFDGSLWLSSEVALMGLGEEADALEAAVAQVPLVQEGGSSQDRGSPTAAAGASSGSSRKASGSTGSTTGSEGEEDWTVVSEGEAEEAAGEDAVLPASTAAEAEAPAIPAK